MVSNIKYPNGQYILNIVVLYYLPVRLAVTVNGIR